MALNTGFSYRLYASLHENRTGVLVLKSFKKRENMKKIIKAVINCTTKAHVALNKKAMKVIKSMTDNAATFPGTDADVAKLAADQKLYAGYIAGAKGNSQIKAQRDSMAPVIMEDLQELLPPVNKVAAGDPAIIAQSGFDSSADPTPSSIPKQVIIKRIENGETSQTGKIYIDSMGQYNLTFHIRISTVANAPVNDPSWTTVVQTTNSRELIIPNLTRGKEVFVQVNAMNTAGTGLWSESFSFILQ